MAHSHDDVPVGKRKEAAFRARQARWRHNSFIGSAVMMRAQCQAIILSATATDATKRVAQTIFSNAEKLERLLRAERKDGNG